MIPRDHEQPLFATIDRRAFVRGAGSSAAGLLASAFLASEARGEDTGDGTDGASGRGPHFPPRAKACIFLLMEGGPSHIDTFDPKPKLDELHMRTFVRSGEERSAMESGKRYWVRSPFRFRKAGACGADVAESWEHFGEVVDKVCFFRGCQAESVNHPTALYHINTGNRFGGDPAVGSWATWGLGSENRDLPGFVVLPELAYPQGGAANWSNGFLPARYQGTPLRPVGSPILDLRPPSGITREHQKANLDLLEALNRRHLARHPDEDALVARMASYELAFRMQMRVPGILDLDQESESTREAYGVGDPISDSFARRCLLARRLVERGVRFVQVWAASWDSHDYIERAHGRLVRAVDRPIAALLRDLDERGLLDETLVVWCGEFGRSPDNGVRGGVAYGRDHNARAMPLWLAGGGVRAGHTVGATDDTGAEAVEVARPIRDLHVTLLRLLGLDDNRLTYFHGGRHKQLSQFGGQVIEELLA